MAMGMWAMVVAAGMMAGLAWANETTTHYRMVIRSRLGPEEQNNVNCMFYRASLGVYSIRNDENVEWDLPVWDDRSFDCVFNWQNKYADGVLFVKTHQGSFCGPDNNCVWELRPDGVYFLHDSNPDQAQRVLQWKE